MGSARSVGFSVGFVALVVRPFMKLFTHRRWEGAEHLPSQGGVLVIVNHTSMFDPLVVAHYLYDNGRVPRFLAKSGLFSLPLIGRILHGAGQIPVFRQSRDASLAYTAAVAAVQRGECVVVYPEGTVTGDPGYWPMVGKTGAARIALATGVPVIPLAQWGSERVLPRHAKFLHLFPRRTMQLRAGAPVDLADVRGTDPTPEVLRQVTERLLDAVTDLLADLRDETPPAVRYDARRALPPADERGAA